MVLFALLLTVVGQNVSLSACEADVAAPAGGCICSGVPTVSPTCSEGQRCIAGRCKDPGADRIKVNATTFGLCGKFETLDLAAPQYKSEANYLTTDAHGNCMCPPKHLCYTKQLVKELQGVMTNLAGNDVGQNMAKAALAELKFVIGCPVIDTDHTHWKTSRTQYNWRAKSAVCREIVSDPWAWNMHEMWLELLTVSLVILLLLLLCICCRRRTPAPSSAEHFRGRMSTQRSESEQFRGRLTQRSDYQGRLQSPRDISRGNMQNPQIMEKTAL